MIKMVNASCSVGVVKIDGLEVQADILSQGEKPSTGVGLIDGEKVVYLTSNASDIADLISAIEGVIDQVVTICQTLDGVTTAPGSATAAIAQLTTLKTQMALQKDELK